MQKYFQHIKEDGEEIQRRDAELCKKIITTTYKVYNDRTLSVEQFMAELEKTNPETKFIYELCKKQVAEWGISMLPVSQISSAGIIGSYIPEVMNLHAKSEKCDILCEDMIDSYVRYVPHVYRTLKVSNSFTSGEDVVSALNTIVQTVPGIMTDKDVNEFMVLIGMKRG